MAAPQQGTLVPLAAGHEVASRPAAPTEPVAPAATQAPAAQAQAPVAAPTPFRHDAPESTFSLVDLCASAPSDRAAAPQLERVPADLEQPVRATPPSFREIRAGRAAAASRAPIAEVRIPVAEIEGITHAQPAAQGMLPSMDGLVERVRQRTAARLSVRRG